jgi:hypothetical protein
MSFETALKEIESHNFAARLGVANNEAMLRAIATKEQSVVELMWLLRSSESASRLLSHTSFLIREQDDVRYRNSRDTAIAVYIWLLAQMQPSLGRLLAAEAIRAPRLWWGRKMALSVLAGHPFTIDPSTATNRIVLKDEWQNDGGADKETLVIRESAGELVREGRVLNTTDISHKGDTTSTTKEVGDASNRSLQAGDIRTKLASL